MLFLTLSPHMSPYEVIWVLPHFSRKSAGRYEGQERLLCGMEIEIR